MKASQVIPSGHAPTGNEPSIAERYNRLRKAIKIADHLQAKGCTSSMAQGGIGADALAYGVRVIAGVEVGVDTPSETTWAEVVSLLVGREQAVDALRRKQDKAVAR